MYIVRILYPNGIRFVNYHDIYHSDVDNFRKQIKFYHKYYYLISPDQIDSFRNGSIKTNKTGLVITFDDGLLSQYKYAYPVLKEYGIEALYFIPPGFIDAGEINESRKFADEHQIEYFDNPIDSISINWHQLNDLLFVGSHTMNHCRLEGWRSNEEIIFEIVESKKRLELALRRDIIDFCWVGGEENTYHKEAYNSALEAGYERIFTSNNSIFGLSSTYNFINRNNVEACYPVSLVSFQTCGITDFLNNWKRRRVTKRLQA